MLSPASAQGSVGLSDLSLSPGHTRPVSGFVLWYYLHTSHKARTGRASSCGQLPEEG